ncbi:hypothetical protein CRE_17350 [Caenorhabditis remanei]|uniref:Uncharacterized protein n=1 Tax=Caenorhabditis remanei TaxID=31234 RepID=E3MS18_CAERE|nr:hypothetical protein CRE_17350 [Caenorhabditis remanei]
MAFPGEKLNNGKRSILGVRFSFDKLSNSSTVAEEIALNCKPDIEKDVCADEPEFLTLYCIRHKRKNCDTLIREGVEKYCDGSKSSPACDWLEPSTTASPLNLPIIIGAVGGVVILLIIAIAVFCFVKKRKLAKKGKTMTGTTVGSTTATGATITGTPTVGTPTATDNGSRY